MLLFIFGLVGMVIGLTWMRLSLSNLLRHRLSRRLAELSDSPCFGFLLGILCAALLQGSSAVTLLTIGLVSSRILTFPQSIAILLGANVGTCSTIPLLLALPLDSIIFLRPYLAILIIIFYLIPRTRPLGGAIGGLCLMLLGFDTLQQAGNSFLQQSQLLTLLDYADTNPTIAIGCGSLLTFALQSASSSTLLLTALYEESLLAPHTVCYLVYGNNIGSCLSSVLVSSAAPPAGKMTALANLLLNIGGTLLFLPLTDVFMHLATNLSLAPSEQLVFYHTMFNLISALLLLPFTHSYAQLIEWLCKRGKA